MCPGELIYITCTHDNVQDEVTRWNIQSSTVNCTRVISHTAVLSEDMCGPFAITGISMNSGPVAQLNVNSTLHIPAAETLEGAVVECRAGAPLKSSQVGSVTLHVIGEANYKIQIIVIFCAS